MTKPAHRPNRGGACSHRNYQLTCEQYEQLRQRANYQCEICGRPESGEWLGVLRIDHVHNLGQWAVRGLLCHRCNSSFDLGAIAGPERDAYLRNAWYVHMLAEHGLPPGMPPEPPVGAVVHDGLRSWTRTSESSWACSGRHRPRGHTSMTWRNIVYRYGPHNLSLRDEQGVPKRKPGGHK